MRNFFLNFEFGALNINVRIGSIEFYFSASYARFIDSVVVEFGKVSLGRGLFRLFLWMRS